MSLVHLTPEKRTDFMTIRKVQGETGMVSIQSLLDSILDRSSVNGLFLTGGMGFGKSHLLGFLKDAADRAKMKTVWVDFRDITSMSQINDVLKTKALIFGDNLTQSKVEELRLSVPHGCRLLATRNTSWPPSADAATYIIPGPDDEELEVLWRKLHVNRRRLHSRVEITTLRRMCSISGGSRAAIVEAFKLFVSGICDSIQEAAAIALSIEAEKWWAKIRCECSPLQHRIISSISNASAKSEAVTAGELAARLGVTHNSLTHSVSILRRKGLITEVRKGRFVQYELQNNVGIFLNQETEIQARWQTGIDF